MNRGQTVDTLRSARERTHSTSDVVIVFARCGIPLETLARATAIPVDQVQVICMRAIEDGDLQIVPPRKPEAWRSSMMAELTNQRMMVTTLQEEVRALRGAGASDVERYVGVAKLSESEAALVCAVAKHGRISKTRLYNALYALDPEGGPEPKILDVLLCKARKKLKPYGVEIVTHWGVGVEMTRENVERFRALAPDYRPPMIESPPLAAVDQPTDATVSA